MKIASHIAAALLGLVFIVFSSIVLFHLVNMPPPPAGPPTLFFGAIYPTGYLTFIKLLELIGGVLVIIPATRTLGLLILGPIIVNILAYHTFLMKGEGLVGPPLLVGALGLFLLWGYRGAFGALIRSGASAP